MYKAKVGNGCISYCKKNLHYEYVSCKKADGSPKYTLAQRMSVSGHKTESQYVNYIKCSLDEYAEMVAAANEIDGDNLF